MAGVMVVLAVMALVGCSRTVTGSAQRAVESGEEPAHGYGYTDDRCGLLHDSTVQEIVGADELVRPYSGAVCQYVLMKQSTVIDVTYSWFESGSIGRERRLAESNKAQITEIVLERRPAFLARRAVTGNACAATADTNPGVASWWVQVRGDALSDPCLLAQTLLAKTLSSDM
ncbi:MAG: DUF3558 domain-containing protein [Candidatus Sericytochromatia bacterium]